MSPSHLAGPRLIRLPLLLLPVLLPGCGPGPEDLQGWLQQPEGAYRLAALVADGEREQPLRVAAARLLVEHGAAIELTEALARCPAAQSTMLVAALTPTLLGMLQGPQDAQVRAKEAIHHIGGHAPPQEQQQMAQGLLRWAMEDLPGRFRLGRNSLAQVLPGLGRPAAVALLRQLREGRAPAECIEALQAFGSPEVERAAATVLAEQVRRALPALPLPLGNAVLRLQRPELTEVLVEAAGHPQVDKGVRAALLDHVLDCGGPQAGPGLARLLGDADFRWTAAHHLLELERLDGLRRLLLALPEAASWPELDEELYQNVDFFCSDILAGLNEPKEAVEGVLLDGLQRGTWPGKLTAIHCLTYFGSPVALPELGRAAALTRRLPGWKPANATLGQVAQAAIARLRG